MFCVQALRAFDERPSYVSIESNVTSNEAPFERIFDELAELWTLGYRSFKYVNQRAHPTLRLPDPPLEGSFVEARFTEEASGPFGEEHRTVAVDRQGAGSGQGDSAEPQFRRVGGKYRRPLVSRGGKFRQAVLHRPTGWYDLHARHGSLIPEAADR